MELALDQTSAPAKKASREKIAQRSFLKTKVAFLRALARQLSLVSQLEWSLLLWHCVRFSFSIARDVEWESGPCVLGHKGKVQLQFLGPRTYHQVNGFLRQAPSQVPRRMHLLLGLLVVCLSSPIKTLLTKQVPWQNRATYLLTRVVCSTYTLTCSLVLNLLKDISHVTLKNLDPRLFR